MKKISLLIPCYNEEESVPLFYKEVTRVLCELKYEYELLFINDGSTDKTLEILKQLGERDMRVKYILLT